MTHERITLYLLSYASTRYGPLCTAMNSSGVNNGRLHNSRITIEGCWKTHGTELNIREIDESSEREM